MALLSARVSATNPSEGSQFAEDAQFSNNMIFSRVGIATSKSPYGPWTRYDKPIVETKPDIFYSFLAYNPP